MSRRYAAVAACLLALVTFDLSRPAVAQILGDRTEATNCASAIGGSVNNSTVSVVCGIPPEVLDALVRDRTQDKDWLIQLLQTNLDLNKRQIQAALDVAGKAGVPPERIAQTLVEIANEYKRLLVQVQAKPGEDRKRPAKAVAPRARELQRLVQAAA